ncbi:hypothetical protein HMI54_009791 [Coelomomyces lativittatus]|nr:hypothetical protein HMI54_009791 [Coelomomyces lativittatus]
MMSAPLSVSTRDIKIKTGVVKRLSKELDMYKLEALQQESKIEEMISSGKDEYDIKKQVTYF